MMALAMQRLPSKELIAYLNTSTPGVVFNSDASVSFGIGYNTVNGYVAQWSGVTSGPDGAFSVKSEWDFAQGSGNQNTKGYAMSAFKLEEVDAAPPATAWTAYNDSVYDAGTNGYIGTNVTEYGIGIGFSGDTFGELLDQASGTPTGVTATLTESGGVNWQPSASSWNGGYDTAAGTDAYNTFNGIADMTGVVYYGPATGWYVDLTFTGLDPAAQYTFATSASRANPAYTDRYSIYTISDVDAATNSSTAGTQEYLGDPMAVWFNTGDNHGDGYVARWTTIQPGANGSFTVRAEAHPSANSGYKAYAFDVFMLEEEGGTPPVQYDLTVNTDGSGTVDLVPPGGIYDEGTSVELTAVPNGGWIFDSWAGDLSGSANPETITMDGNKTVTATFVTEPIAENWTAYVDLRSEAGDSNQTNVLAIIPTGPDIQPIDPAVDWVLKDFATGANLPITMTVDMDIRYPTTNGADSDPGTDAALLFGGIVDGVGGYEIEDISSDYVTLNFGNLNPDKEYILAVTNNRANIDYDNRATNFTITGADTFVNASSSGVFVYGEDSISFSTGNNTANGYVAQWTGITAADGSFSINAVQDTSQPGWDGSKAYAMTSIMLQEYDPPAELVCETFDAFTVGANVGSHADWFDGDGGPIVNAAGGVALSQGLDPAGSIFTWMAQPFFWDDPATNGYKASMDFQTSATGQFDDDRIGWMIEPNSTDSDLIFGVQLDNADSHLRMEGYWDHVINVNENIRVEMADLDSAGNSGRHLVPVGGRVY